MNKLISMIKEDWDILAIISIAFVIAPTVITLMFKGYGSLSEFIHNLTFAFTVTTVGVWICCYLNKLDMRRLNRKIEMPTCSLCNKKTGVFWECAGGKVIICCDCAINPSPNNNAH